MICFLILNYIAYNETISCVESIRLICKDTEYHIVIVDNGSCNDSVQCLYERYGKANDVTIIQSQENLGFAKGNNLGYFWIKEHFNDPFIVATNSDVIFTQKEFVKKIFNKYEEDIFDVMGPDICRPIPGGIMHQNPFKCHSMSKISIEKEIECLATDITKLTQDKVYQLKFKIKFMNEIFKNKVRTKCPRVVQYYRKVRKITEDSACKSEKRGCMLHGSCLIFSPRYVKKHDWLFYPQTFLYSEERILYYLVMREKGIMIYYPKINVIHKHGQSTKMLTKGAINRTLFQKKQLLASRKILLSLIEQNERGK